MVVSMNASFSPSQLHSDYFAQSHLSSGEEQSKVNGIADKVHLSREGIAKSDKKEGHSSDQELSEEQKKEVQNLKKRDQEVKAHERAHIASGAGLVQGGASYEYQRGPDGKLYAVGGEVKIDVSAERDPDQTARKMAQVRQAALAPSEPSGQDRAVAAQAAQVAAEAQAQKREEQAEKAEENGFGEDETTEVAPEAVPGSESEQNIPSEITPEGTSEDNTETEAHHQPEESVFQPTTQNTSNFYSIFQESQTNHTINITA